MKVENINLKTPLIVIGMTRSGTTLISHILGMMPNVHSEIEPHALWKSGNFKYDSDEEFDLKKKNIDYIRKKFISKTGDKILVEKSPHNVIRPELVHAVFPEAKIIYIERDPVKCISSNHKRSLSNDSFKPSIVLKKYFYYTGSKDLEGAISKRSLLQQIRISDIPNFTRYVIKMLWLRQVKKSLPFGTKLKNFWDILKKQGDLGYHVKVYKKAQEKKSVFESLYGANYNDFTMEKIMTEKSELERLFKFCGFTFDDELIRKTRGTFDVDRVKSALSEKSEVEIKIESILRNK